MCRSQLPWRPTCIARAQLGLDGHTWISAWGKVQHCIDALASIVVLEQPAQRWLGKEVSIRGLDHTAPGQGAIV